jgi:hypothetical protein
MPPEAVPPVKQLRILAMECYLTCFDPEYTVEELPPDEEDQGETF